MKKSILLFTFILLGLTCPIVAQQFCSTAKITDLLGSENPVIGCDYLLNGKCLQLQATYPTFYETNSYTISSENFSPYGKFNEGTSLNADADDLFINKIDIPFSFCYFGNSYKEVIIGSNGTITFDTAQLGKVNYPNVENLNPNISLPNNSIFGVFSDLVFSKTDDSEIYYSVIGNAPCRKLVINFYKGRVLGCNQTSTSQIVLSEGSNIIEVFVENKPIFCGGAKFENSLIGIINSDAAIGYSPAGRNSGIWEAEREAWKFTPSGSAIVPQVSWFDSSDENIGSGDTVNVCPEKDEIYKVKVSYQICGNSDLVIEDTASVTFLQNFPLVKNFTKVFCGSDSLNINLADYVSNLTPQDATDFSFTFYNTLLEAQNSQNPQPTNFLLDSNKRFYVRVQSNADSACFRTAIFNLNLISKSLLTSTIEICDINNDGVEDNYLLSLFNTKLFASPINGSIHYFLSQSNADNNINEVKTINFTNNLQLYVNYKTANCSQTFGPITISFAPSPVVNTPINFKYTTCDYLRDFVEPFEFLLILGPLVSADPGVLKRFYATYQEAYTGIGAQLTTIKERQYQVFVRVEFPGGCFSIATINLDITFNEIEAVDHTEYICFDGTKDITVNLSDYAPEKMLIDPLIGIATTFFLSLEDAETDTDPISNLQTITEDGDFVTKIFFAKFSDSTDCYAVKAININLVHVVIKKNQFKECDFNNDGKENITLSKLTGRIIGSQDATVSYFLTVADAQSNSNAITKYNVQNSKTLFVRILSFGCFDIFEIKINLVPTPTIKENVSVIRNGVCDNNNDALEPFDLTSLESEVYAGSETVAFKFYENYNPANNSLTGLIDIPSAFLIPKTSTVFAKVSFSGGCYSVSTLKIKLNFVPAIVLKKAVLQKCDYEFNLNESFELKDALPQLFVQNENVLLLGDLKITYFKSEVEANAGIPSTEINSPLVTNNSKTIIWARFTSQSIGCYSVTEIELQTYQPPKAKNTIIKDLCDENLDGLFDVNLLSFKESMVYTQDSLNLFTFFSTQSEADLNNNPILTPEKFSFFPSVTRVWVRVENISGCFDTASVDFTFGQKIIFDDNGPFLLTECDTANDNVENVDLTKFEKQIYKGNAAFDYYPTLLDINDNTNKITSPQSYLFNLNSGSPKIFVKVSATGFCPETVEINLSFKESPVLTLPDYSFCPNGFVDIQPDFSNLDLASFEWKDPTGTIISTTKELLKVKTAGNYSLKVTATNNCTFTTNFKVTVDEVPVITNLIPSGSSYTVIAAGTETILYGYSVDGQIPTNFQSENVFYNLPFGVITFYVKFEGSPCLGEPKEGLVLKITNAFSPNNDGINDTWIIDDLYVFNGQKTNIKIFNRLQQKVFEQESATRLEWNGQTLSRVVPTDSYWYILTLADGRMFTGWVLVKDRN